MYEIKETADGYVVNGLEFSSLRAAQRYLDGIIKRAMNHGVGAWSGS